MHHLLILMELYDVFSRLEERKTQFNEKGNLSRFWREFYVFLHRFSFNEICQAMASWMTINVACTKDLILVKLSKLFPLLNVKNQASWEQQHNLEMIKLQDELMVAKLEFVCWFTASSCNKTSTATCHRQKFPTAKQSIVMHCWHEGNFLGWATNKTLLT